MRPAASESFERPPDLPTLIQAEMLNVEQAHERELSEMKSENRRMRKRLSQDKHNARRRARRRKS